MWKSQTCIGYALGSRSCRARVARWPSRALVLPASSQTVPSDQPTRPDFWVLGTGVAGGGLAELRGVEQVEGQQVMTGLRRAFGRGSSAAGQRHAGEVELELAFVALAVAGAVEHSVDPREDVLGAEVSRRSPRPSLTNRSSVAAAICSTKPESRFGVRPSLPLAQRLNSDASSALADSGIEIERNLVTFTSLRETV